MNKGDSQPVMVTMEPHLKQYIIFCQNHGSTLLYDVRLAVGGWPERRTAKRKVNEERRKEPFFLF